MEFIMVNLVCSLGWLMENIYGFMEINLFIWIFFFCRLFFLIVMDDELVT